MSHTPIGSKVRKNTLILKKENVQTVSDDENVEKKEP